MEVGPHDGEALHYRVPMEGRTLSSLEKAQLFPEGRNFWAGRVSPWTT